MSIDVEKRNFYCPYCGNIFYGERRTLTTQGIKKITSSVVCPQCNNNLKVDSGEKVD